MTRKQGATRTASPKADLSKTQHHQRIAEFAYELWLARGFRDGSPEEDLLRALCAFKEIQISCRDAAPG
jgi:hypothetical protein